LIFRIEESEFKMKRYKIDDVKSYIESEGYSLVSEDFQGVKSKIDIKCINNHIFPMTFDNFKNNKRRCPECQGLKRRDINYVRKEFELRGYELLSKVYKNTRTKLEYKCPIGHSNKISFQKFQAGQGCPTCGGSEKLTIDFVRSEFLKFRLTLKSHMYVNAHSDLDYECESGHSEKVTYARFSNGQNECQACRGLTKWNYKSVKDAFEENHCILLSDFFQTVDHKIRYICECGIEAETTFYHFYHRGQRCNKCAEIKRREKQRTPYEDVKKEFDKYGLNLLATDYLNEQQSLEYICVCGKANYKSLNNLRSNKYKMCKKCVIKKFASGENHHNWSSERTDYDRLNRRQYTDYYRWRKKVFERDNFRCQVCGQKGSTILNAHHLDGYHWCIEKRTDVDNGVTLCEGCHSGFHSIYGMNNNKREQFVEYKNTNLKRQG
jgi:5-methylcytosine-specific restriction endonuclease McrA